MHQAMELGHGMSARCENSVESDGSVIWWASDKALRPWLWPTGGAAERRRRGPVNAHRTAQCGPTAGERQGPAVANVLSLEKRADVVAHLVEGSGIRATSRLTGVSLPAVLSTLVLVGLGCARLHNRIVRGLAIGLIEADEIWSYVQKKQSRVTAGDPEGVGEAYTYVAMGAVCKLVISYAVGKRNQETTNGFVRDLRSRITVIPQLTTDGFRPYPLAVGMSFGTQIDFATLTKHYTKKGRRDDDHRYEPPRDPFITKDRVFGAPDMAKASTSHVERQNLTMRMHIRRLTRLCNGFSKKLENHQAAIALHFAWYNFCRIHEALRVTPAMEAGLTDRVWTIAELVDLAMSEPAGDAPVAVPLARRDGSGPARELPGGKGWLRLVGGKDAPIPSSPAPVVPIVQPALIAVAAPAETKPVEPPSPQLLLDWKPKPRVAFSPTGQGRFWFAADWPEPPKKDGPGEVGR